MERVADKFDVDEVKVKRPYIERTKNRNSSVLIVTSHWPNMADCDSLAEFLKFDFVPLNHHSPAIDLTFFEIVVSSLRAPALSRSNSSLICKISSMNSSSVFPSSSITTPT